MKTRTPAWAINYQNQMDGISTAFKLVLAFALLVVVYLLAAWEMSA